MDHQTITPLLSYSLSPFSPPLPLAITPTTTYTTVGKRSDLQTPSQSSYLPPTPPVSLPPAPAAMVVVLEEQEAIPKHHPRSSVGNKTNIGNNFRGNCLRLVPPVRLPFFLSLVRRHPIIPSLTLHLSHTPSPPSILITLTLPISSFVILPFPSHVTRLTPFPLPNLSYFLSRLLHFILPFHVFLTSIALSLILLCPLPLIFTPHMPSLLLSVLQLSISTYFLHIILTLLSFAPTFSSLLTPLLQFFLPSTHSLSILFVISPLLLNF